MSNMNIFQNTAKAIPEQDNQIVRINLGQADIGGRKSHMPATHIASDLPLSHVPNAGSTPGGSA
jgi:hypothetical protein